MSIDGIGGPGRKAPTAGSPDVSGAGGASFDDVLQTESTQGTGSVAGTKEVTGTEGLSRLERGELNLDQYLDLRVDEAVSHLKGKLSPEQLSFVCESLRAQLSTDPVLVELVRRTTGMTPSEPAG